MIVTSLRQQIFLYKRIPITKATLGIPLKALLVSFLLFGSCARFRINELKPGVIFSIPVSLPKNTPHSKNTFILSQNEHVAHGLPLKITTWDNKVIVTDHSNQQINIYYRNQQIPYAIIGKNFKDKRIVGEAILKKVNFHQSGIFATSVKENLFCFVTFLKTITPKKAIYKIGTPPERPITTGTKIDFNLSQIECLNDDLETATNQNTVQQINDEKLLAIQDIYISKNAMGVLHNIKKNKKEWVKSLTVFAQDIESQTYNRDSFDFLKRAMFKGKHAEIESMVLSPIDNEVYVLISLHKKNNYELISKTLYRLKGPKEIPEELYQSDDPSDFFACPLLNGGFYIKNTGEDGDRILFKIFDADGIYLKNVRVNLPGIRASWRETFCTSDASIFSNRLYRGQYELYEWK